MTFVFAVLVFAVGPFSEGTLDADDGRTGGSDVSVEAVTTDAGADALDGSLVLLILPSFYCMVCRGTICRV